MTERRLRILIQLTTIINLFSIVKVTSYSKVSKNGLQTDSISQVNSEPNEGVENQGRYFKNNPITSAKKFDLRPGEVIDYNPVNRPSNLDHEILSQLNSMTKKQLNERYTPPSIFQTVKKVRGKPGTNGDNVFLSADTIGDYSLSSDLRPTLVPNLTRPNGQESENYDNFRIPEKPPSSIKDSYVDLTNFDDTHGVKIPPSDDFPHYVDHPPFAYEHNVEYDHAHFYNHHDFPEHHTTTEQPDTNDQRLSKRPYSYYYLGRKLWYVPLYFSIYFIIYVAALILKSVARHKINFPANLAAVTGDLKNNA